MGRRRKVPEAALYGDLERETTADRTKSIRLYFEDTQEEFAQRLGVSQSLVSAIELGQKQPNKEVIEGIVKLNFDANWYLTGELKSGDKQNTSKAGMKIIQKMLEMLSVAEIAYFQKMIQDYIKLKETAKK